MLLGPEECGDASISGVAPAARREVGWEQGSPLVPGQTELFPGVSACMVTRGDGGLSPGFLWGRRQLEDFLAAAF